MKQRHLADDPLHTALAEIRPAQDDAAAASLRAAVRRRLFGTLDEPGALTPAVAPGDGPPLAGHDDRRGRLRARVWLGAALLLGLIALLCAVEAVRTWDPGEVGGSERPR